MEKNFRNQLRDEVKRKKGLVEELRQAERRIEDLGKIICEKDKIINRLHIYSRGRKLPTIKHKEFSSTPSNLDTLGVSSEEDVVTRLDKKLKDLEIKRSKVRLEKVELQAETVSASDKRSEAVSPAATSSGRHLSSNNKGRRNMMIKL